ncbi:MAG: segregation/condensation protein A [Saprospiraceae bacterium]|nr:segregation/condensation protein A [Saprospiraceae bacterium]
MAVTQLLPTSYSIKLPQFEGPFDLLLFFIERDELDIHDIPIAKITDDFLHYIRAMEALNIDLASEFILVAATLMRIKAKMLLPRKALDDEGNEIDPRQELVQRLLEYKRYKSVLEDLRQFEEARADKQPRGNAAKELREIATKALVDVELESLSLFRLLKVFRNVMERYELQQTRQIHTIYNYNYTVLEQQSFILGLLNVQQRVDFDAVFSNCENRIHAIVTFLALLELLNLQRIGITQGLGANNFWIEHRRGEAQSN